MKEFTIVTVACSDAQAQYFDTFRVFTEAAGQTVPITMVMAEPVATDKYAEVLTPYLLDAEELDGFNEYKYYLLVPPTFIFTPRCEKVPILDLHLDHLRSQGPSLTYSNSSYYGEPGSQFRRMNPAHFFTNQYLADIARVQKIFKQALREPLVIPEGSVFPAGIRSSAHYGGPDAARGLYNLVKYADFPIMGPDDSFKRNYGFDLMKDTPNEAQLRYFKTMVSAIKANEVTTFPPDFEQKAQSLL